MVMFAVYLILMRQATAAARPLRIYPDSSAVQKYWGDTDL
jgi:hypothetical protein